MDAGPDPDGRIDDAVTDYDAVAHCRARDDCGTHSNDPDTVPGPENRYRDGESGPDADRDAHADAVSDSGPDTDADGDAGTQLSSDDRPDTEERDHGRGMTDPANGRCRGIDDGGPPTSDETMATGRAEVTDG